MLSKFGRDFPRSYPTARVEVPDGTVGEFVTDYLTENGRQTLIIGQLSVNDSDPGEVD